VARKGRKPKPTAVKQAAGNPGGRRLNTQEPRPKVVNLPCPKELQGEARSEWERVAPELAKNGVLTRLDEKALLGYCVAWQRFVEAQVQIGDPKSHVLMTKSGYPILNPYLSIADKALDTMRKFAVEFGMTPSSRSNIHVVPEDENKAQNPFAELASDAFSHTVN
jgi:P27 family predicted phage terminase small subunit